MSKELVENIENAEELRFKIDQVLIHYALFDEALSRIKRCYCGALYGSDPSCLAIVEESRSGKTRILEHFESMFPRFRVDDGLKVPVLRIKVHSKPTVKGLVEELLHSIGDPLYNAKITENEKTRQLKAQLKNAETKLIFLDEFQHFIDQGTDKIQHHVTDWLKILVDDLRIGLVVAGLPSSISVISKNDQLIRRFSAPVELRRYDWLKKTDKNEFRSILYSIQKSLAPFIMPDLDTELMASRIYVASGGLIGYIIKLLREATAIALDSGTLEINMNALKQSYNYAIMDKIEDFGNPFDETFNFIPTPSSIAQLHQLREDISPHDLKGRNLSSLLHK